MWSDCHALSSDGGRAGIGSVNSLFMTCNSLHCFFSLQEACHQYWPNTGVVQIGEYTVELLEEEKKEGFIVRTISILARKVIIHCSVYHVKKRNEAGFAHITAET